ncbi:MAG: N-6 DNA methylase, partial [Helicobacter sp.]|nr:N-6 DNA methylase [Helicobacter sp.]
MGEDAIALDIKKILTREKEYLAYKEQRELTEQQLEQLAFRNELLSTEDGRNALQFAMQTKMYGTQSEQNIAKEILAKQGYYLNYDGALSLIEGKTKPENPIDVLSKNAEMMFGTDTPFMQQMKEGFASDINKKWWIVPRGKHSVVEYAKEIDPSLVSFERADVGSWYADVQGIVHKVALKKQDTLMIEHYASNEIPPAKTWIFHNENQITHLMQAYNGDVLLIDTLNKDNTRTILAKNKDTITKTSIDASGNATTTHEEAGKNVELFSKFLQESEGIETAGKGEADVVAKESQRLQEIAEDFKGRFPNLSSQEMLEGISNTIATRFPNLDFKSAIDAWLLSRDILEDSQHFGEKKGAIKLTSERHKLEKLLKIEPITEFGTNYAEFYHSGTSAIQKVMQEKQGQVSGAFYREDLGDITIAWGEVTDADKHKGYGLAHILDRHPNMNLELLNEAIQKGTIAKTHNGYNISYNGYRVGINQGWNVSGEKTHSDHAWVVTAFEKEKQGSNSASNHTAETLAATPQDNSTPPNIKNTLENGDVQHDNPPPAPSAREGEKGKPREEGENVSAESSAHHISATEVAPPKHAEQAAAKEQADDVGEAAAKADEPQTTNDVDLQAPLSFFVSQEFGEALALRSGKQRLSDNLEALRTLGELAGGAALNAERQQSLAKYSGFGGLMVKDVEGMRQLLLPIAEKDAFVQHALLGKGIYDAHHRADILYSQIAANADNSYYTPHSVISAIWEHLGFVRGRVLEPSMGIGNFFTSMPAALSHRTQKVGVEIDPIAAAIGKQLSPDVDVQAKSFYDYKGDVGFDLVIGNPPYGEHLKDFILKSVDSAKENGIIVQVVSNAFLDNAASRDVRTAIAQRAELLGAVRLPSKTFSGTDIATDIVVFQKRSNRNNSIDWRGAKTYKEDSELTLNNYYHENPEHILGELVVGNTQYGQRWIVKQGEDIEGALHEKLAAILSRRENESDSIMARENDVQESVAHGLTPNTFFLLNDTIMQAQKNAEPIAVDFLQSVRGNGASFETLNKSAQTRRTNEAKKAESMAKDYLALRDSLLALRSSEARKTASEESLQVLRQTLNDNYDSFVKKFGKVSENALLKKVFAQDPSFSSVADLDARGRHQILDSRVIFPYQIPTKAKDIQDAIAISKGYAGTISEDYINALLGDRYAVQKALESGELFADAKGNLFTKDAFVVGDLGARIDSFKQLKELNPQQKKALETLEAALPEPLDIKDIYYHPSSSFIPKEAMLGFFDSLGVKATYYKPTNSFIIDHKSGSHTFQTAYSAITENMEHSATAVLESLLKNKPLRFSKQIDGVKQSYPEQFAANKMAQEKLLEAFYRYMQKNHAKDIADSYNHKFRRIVANDFQDEPILYGANPDITLHPHQKSAVAFATSLQNVLLDHSVGAGKTFEMIAIASEWKRLGISKNPLFVVPNHLVEQWAKSFTQLYPASRVLTIPTNEVERKRTLAMLANGGNDYDAVIMPHSTFDSIHLSNEKSAKYVYEEIQEVEQFEKEIRQQKTKDPLTKAEQKRLEKSIAKKKIALQQKYDKLLETQGAKEDSIAFEELGFDSLFVDEAHAYKNLGFLSANRNIRGMGNSVGSQKALNLLHKVKSMQEREQRIVFATGTPLVNSVSEVYTWQRFLAPQFLKDNKIATFDRWVSLFGEVSSELERTPVGTYKDIMRLRSFRNTSELSALYRQFAHYVDVSQTHIKRPNVEQVSIQCPSSPQQKEYMQHLLKRYEALSEDEAIEGFPNDNFLNITTDGINAALDYRIIDKGAEDFSESKINRATSEMLKLYKESSKDLGTQLVFIDRSTPKPKRGIRDEIKNLFEEYYHAKDEKTEEALAQKLEEMAEKHHYDNIDSMRNAVYNDFSVYEDMRDKLIKSGIPKEQIAFIHDYTTDAQKAQLFADVNAGKIRFLFGSTKKMGAGMNVQERIVGLHHIDAAWNPADMEQRDGRAIRQGNILAEKYADFKIKVFRYVTENSCDAVYYSKLEQKATSIKNFRSGHAQKDDLSDDVILTLEELKALATGDTRELEKASLNKELQNVQYQLNALKSANTFQEIERQARTKDIKILPQEIANLKDDLEIAKQRKIRKLSENEKESLRNLDIVPDNKEPLFRLDNY